MSRPERFTFVRLKGEADIEGYTIGETDACIADIEAEASALRKIRDGLANEVIQAQKRIAELEAEKERLREAGKEAVSILAKAHFSFIAHTTAEYEKSTDDKGRRETLDGLFQLYLSAHNRANALFTAALEDTR